MVAGLFLAAVFFSPVAAAIPGYCDGAGADPGGRADDGIDGAGEWKEFSEAFPAFVTLVATPLTFSIATGLSLGVISYTVAKVAAGKCRKVSLLLWILTGFHCCGSGVLAILDSTQDTILGQGGQEGPASEGYWASTTQRKPMVPARSRPGAISRNFSCSSRR